MRFWNFSFRDHLAPRQDAGCHERHLFRRRQNPLFPRDRQHVSRKDIDFARRRDEAERSALRRQTLKVLQPLMEGGDFVDGRTAIDLLEQVHKLIELVYQYDQGLEQEVAALQHGYQVLSQSIREVRSQEHAAALDAAALTLQRQTAMFRAPLCATLSRPDSPMRPDEVVPSVVDLPFSEFGRCLEGIRMYSGGSSADIVPLAMQFIECALRTGVHVPDSAEKLHLLRGIMSNAR